MFYLWHEKDERGTFYLWFITNNIFTAYYDRNFGNIFVIDMDTVVQKAISLIQD